ncbi:MAG: type II toxin-antitoxin system HicA family toxin [Prevotella sp.]|nr:type II toxin-antitoxin system HicA family toxin [Prevotella sp.]
MNRREKLIKRFRTLPKDFSFEEVIALFQGCGFALENKGATSGSRVKFYNDKDQNSFIMHKPHPNNVVKGYIMRDILNFLLNNGYLK